MASIFSRILSGDVPGHFVAKDNEFFAILDVNPLAIGHVLVIPNKEVDYIFDLEPQYLSRFFAFSQKVAKAIDLSIDCKRVGVAVIGLEVPHAHIHLVPINGVSDINFERPKLKVDPDAMRDTCDRIAKAFISLD